MTAFVRTDMLQPLPAEARNLGAVRWMRTNLFNSPLNAVLSIATLALAGYFLINLAIWLSHGIWNAASLPDCRAQISSAFGPGATGPCWAMVRLRWNQFLFGLYPAEAYWRPAVALALLLVSLAPVLYYGVRRPAVTIAGAAAVLLILSLWGLGASSLTVLIAGAVFLVLIAVAAWMPHRLLWLTIAYPFMAYWLLWGGSAWGPATALIGVASIALLWLTLQARIGSVFATAIAIVAAVIWWLWLGSVLAAALARMLPVELTYIRSDDFGGFMLAFVIGIAAIAASLPFGIILALGRRSDMFLVRTLSVGFIEFIRGVPLITVLFSANFLLLYFLPPRTNFDLILRVIIVVVIFSSAYIAEVIRGGLAALPRGQYEAAGALGLDYWQAQRLIIMPQALKISIPGIVSSFIGLFKDTTLVALVGLMDPLQGVTKVVRADPDWKGIYWEPYIYVGAIFFAVCFSMSRYSMYLERKLKTDDR